MARWVADRAHSRRTRDPAVAPGLNNQQIFIFFLACFAGIVNVLIGLAVTERIRPAAYFTVSAVAAVVSSLLSWVTWGSTGPLTNEGYHDFFGAGFVYVFAGAVALALMRGVGTRPGMFAPHRLVGDYRSYNLGLTTIGLVFIIGGLPFVILSCGFFFAPEALFVSVNMSDTSIGVAFNNLGLAWAGGMLTGALIAYKTKKYIYTLLGPFAGYVSGSPAFDVYSPWEMLLVAMVAPLVGLRGLRVAAAAGDRRAQADSAVPRGRVLRDPGSRPDQVGYGGRLRPGRDDVEKTWGSEPFWGLGYEWDPDWFLTERQRELRAKLIDLCEGEMRANAKRSDDELLYPRRNFEILAENGFLALTVPEEYGGLG